MNAAVLAIAWLLLAACAAQPPAPGDDLFADGRFDRSTVSPDPQRVFAVNDAMRAYLAAEVALPTTTKGRQRALMDALRRSGGLKLEYDAAFTRNAAEAFEARTGNCLSLVIMTAALAREIGVAVRFQSVFVDDTLARSGTLQLFAGHVNISLGRRPPETGTNVDDGEQLMVDFLPPPQLRGLRWREIGENTVLAMYFNNRAVESLAAHRLDDAYWYARAAVEADRDFASAYNTLGVIYVRRGLREGAARAFALALAREPGNTRAMANFVPVLARLGRNAEADALSQRLRELEPVPPFSLFEKGLAAMHAGDYAAARDFFAREVERAPDYHEFHYWLAAALERLGAAREAREHLALALENSLTRKDSERYASKLSHLKQAARR